MDKRKICCVERLTLWRALYPRRDDRHLLNLAGLKMVGLEREGQSRLWSATVARVFVG
jgi:hypothetical protein